MKRLLNILFRQGQFATSCRLNSNPEVTTGFRARRGSSKLMTEISPVITVWTI